MECSDPSGASRRNHLESHIAGCCDKTLFQRPGRAEHFIG